MPTFTCDSNAIDELADLLTSHLLDGKYAPHFFASHIAELIHQDIETYLAQREQAEHCREAVAP